MAEKLTVIADTHFISDREGEQKLFQFLERISHTQNDVVFLGDIFDLWIAIPRYETELQGYFINWCKQEREKRRIYFVEGNHEYYVSAQYGDVFYASSKKGLFINDVYFTHGHLIQGNCFSFNHFFDYIAKSTISRWIMKLMPGGISLAKILQKLLGHKAGMQFEPQALLLHWMESMAYTRCVIGHFHQEKLLTLADKQLEIVYGSAQVGRELSEKQG